MEKRRVSKMTLAKRIVFNIFYTLAPEEAAEWLNEKLEAARIADEEECTGE